MLMTIPEICAISKDNLSGARIRQFLNAGRLKGQKKGGVWLIDKADFQAFEKKKRTNGRPKVAK